MTAHANADDEPKCAMRAMSAGRQPRAWVHLTVVAFGFGCMVLADRLGTDSFVAGPIFLSALAAIALAAVSFPGNGGGV